MEGFEIKFQEYHKLYSSNYFWRTYSQQEIDWVEDRDGKLFAFELKWNKEKVKAPTLWAIPMQKLISSINGIIGIG